MPGQMTRKDGDDGPVLMPSEVSTRVGFFDRFAGWAALVASRATFFAFCVLLIVVWAPSFFLIGNIDTWQLIINTATTIVTFLMVALLQISETSNTRCVSCGRPSASRSRRAPPTTKPTTATTARRVPPRPALAE